MDARPETRSLRFGQQFRLRSRSRLRLVLCVSRGIRAISRMRFPGNLAVILLHERNFLEVILDGFQLGQ